MTYSMKNERLNREHTFTQRRIVSPGGYSLREVTLGKSWCFGSTDSPKRKRSLFLDKPEDVLLTENNASS